jgi:hypothetical protein
MTPIAIYEQQINNYKANIRQVQQRLTGLGWLRLGCFIAIALCVYLFFWQNYALIWLLPAFGLLVGFLAALAKYLEVQEHLVLLKALLELNEKERRLAVTGQSAFDDGQVFVDETHPFTGDLDVFGHASLYSHMNRTGTLQGAKQLAATLRNPLQDAAAVKSAQDAVRELTARLEFRQLFAAQGALAGEQPGDVQSIYTWLKMPVEFVNKAWLNIVRWVVPALLAGAIIYNIMGGSYYYITTFLVINWLLLGMHVKKVTAQHQLVSNKEKIFRKFSLLLELISKEDIEKSGLLQEQKQMAGEAGVALRRFAKICSSLDSRNNLLVGVFLNSFILYDIHAMFSLERWKLQYSDKVQGWLETIARMEVLNSMATFAYNHADYIFPEVQDGAAKLVAKEVGHPLILAEDCVRNDIGIGTPEHFLIITGSNMSGKSTFLRSVGSNLLLALCGMPVCATSFACSPMKIMTSMRIKDSIAKHTSYFQAELLRLQQIVTALKAGDRVFILLDEILKGTNSEDKLSGSRRLIEHFLQYNCLGMIATHDLELGQLEEAYPGKISNYCFESTIKDDHLFFDYRIREGVARNKNATFLMQQMQII